MYILLCPFLDILAIFSLTVTTFLSQKVQRLKKGQNMPIRVTIHYLKKKKKNSINYLHLLTDQGNISIYPYSPQWKG